MIVIGLLGRAGSGKSTAAMYLEQKYGARRYSFAAPVKDLAQHLFQFSAEQVRGSQEQKETIDPRYGFSPREAMIRLGDGARNILWDSVWIDACFRRIARDATDIAVIDDVRYPNEAEQLRSRFDGYVLKLVYADRESGTDPNAPSEKSVDEVSDRFIFGTVHHYWTKDQKSLKQGLDAVLGRIKGL